MPSPRKVLLHDKHGLENAYLQNFENVFGMP